MARIKAADPGEAEIAQCLEVVGEWWSLLIIRDVFLGVIVEGPSKWTVRPVAEVFYEKEFSQLETVSGLVGLIWQVNEDLAVDVGLRHALRNARPVNELRAGVTFGFPVWHNGSTKH
jgi:hypothetical protein